MTHIHNEVGWTEDFMVLLFHHCLHVLTLMFQCLNHFRSLRVVNKNKCPRITSERKNTHEAESRLCFEFSSSFGWSYTMCIICFYKMVLKYDRAEVKTYAAYSGGGGGGEFIPVRVGKKQFTQEYATNSDFWCLFTHLSSLSWRNVRLWMMLLAIWKSER